MKHPDETDIWKIVVARTAQGEVVAVGRMVTYCDAPTVSMQTTGGQQVHWRADLCEVLELDSAVAERLLPRPAGNSAADR